MAKSNEDDVDSFSFPTEFPFEFDSVKSNSSLKSPVGSAASTETERSNEGDYLTRLDRCFTQLSLQDTSKHNLDAITQKTNGFTNSFGSCNVSSNGRSTWDVIYAAAVAEVARKARQSRGNLTDVHGNMQCQSFFSNNVLGHSNQSWEGMLKQQLLAMYEKEWDMGWQDIKVKHLKEQLLDRGRACEFENGQNGHFLVLGQPQLARYSTLQVQNQRKLQQISDAASAVRTGYHLKKKCAGTGVFLPRTYRYPFQAPKKSELSTALLPAKVVQAQLCAQPQPCFKVGQAPNHGSMVGHRNDMLIHQRQMLRANEMRLPQEWTY